MYRYFVTKRTPVALWMLDDEPSFQEYSGGSYTATMVVGHPNPAKAAPLVSGAAYSSVFKSGTQARFDCAIFQQGKEDRPFALEAWILPIHTGTTGHQKIMSHGNVHDGLSINGKVIRFGTTYINSGDAFCQYDLGEYKLAHVVGVHNSDQNQLWVNGQLVASVDLTDAQKGDTYDIGNNAYLYAGNSSSEQQVAMNGAAIYSTLSGDDIQRNYEAGIHFIGQDRVYPQFGGVSFDMSNDSGAVFIEETWLDKEDFERGYNDNLNYALDQLEPVFDGDVSMAGSWTTAIPLDAMQDTSIYGVMVSWTGLGITVEASLDGTTWSAVESGRLVSIIPNGMDPTGKDLQIRVNFAGGITDDPAYLEGLRAVGFRNNTVNNISARPITVTHPAVLHQDYEPNLYRDDNGIMLAGGTLTIGADPTTDPDVARTLELWVKPLSGTPTISVGGTKYRNGVADTTLPVGEWSLIHYVAEADIAGSITISGDVIVGQATLYPTALSAAEVNALWGAYTGNRVVRYTDTNTIGVSEGATPTAIYAHDWAIDSAG